MTHESSPTLAQNRILRLTDTLSQLRDRVREAVASEMGRAIGDAVRDLLTAVLHRGSSPLVNPTPPPRPSSSRYYEDQPEDPWNEDPDWEEPHPPRSRPEEQENPLPESAPQSTARSWTTAVTMGAALARWCLQRKMPTLRSISLGIVTAVVTLSAGPILQSSLSALDIARDLLAVF